MAGGPLESRISGVEHEAQELKEAVERMASNHSGIQNNQPININAGGVAVWISATSAIVCLIVMLVGSVLGGLWVADRFSQYDKRLSDQEVKIDRANTLLAATWAQAPELEKVVRQKIAEDEKHAKR